jgi:hypothetical protein
MWSLFMVSTGEVAVKLRGVTKRYADIVAVDYIDLDVACMHTMGYIPVPVSLPKIDLYVAVSISAVIALVVTFVFYKIALKNAEEFLIKAEI